MAQPRKVIPLRAGNAVDDTALRPVDASEDALVQHGAELNLRILQSLAKYVRDEYGNRTFESIVADVGLTPEDFSGKSRWVSHATFEAVLAACEEQMEDEAEFRAACAYKLKESYGPFAWVFRALSPRLVFEASTKNMGMISKISSYEIVDKGRNFIQGRYSSRRPETRLMCLSRQAQMAVMTQLWGLPTAQLEEKACIAHGDPYCEYHLRWYDVPRWLPALLGATIGGAVLFAVLGLSLAQEALLLAVPVLGAALGYIADQWRTRHSNLALAEEANEALREMAAAESEARAVLRSFRQRDDDWSRRLDERVSERTEILETVAERIRRVQERQTTSIRSVSHDLRSPLQILEQTGRLVRENEQKLGAVAGDTVRDHEDAVATMKRLLDDLMELAQSPESFRLTPEAVEVAPLTGVIRSRLRALANRDVRISVFRTREAPEKIHTDVLVLNRVIDNLLTNAVKYTERGSILAEVGGKQGYLTIKVTDCGRGIEREELEAIFHPGGSDEEKRAPSSFGLGLSIVVQLVAQIGGHLEVRSKVDEGTTFWVHFPVEMQPPAVVFDALPNTGSNAYAELVRRVVTIRKT